MRACSKDKESALALFLKTSRILGGTQANVYLRRSPIKDKSIGVRFWSRRFERSTQNLFDLRRNIYTLQTVKTQPCATLVQTFGRKSPNTRVASFSNMGFQGTKRITFEISLKRKYEWDCCSRALCQKTNTSELASWMGWLVGFCLEPNPSRWEVRIIGFVCFGITYSVGKHLTRMTLFSWTKKNKCTFCHQDVSC